MTIFPILPYIRDCFFPLFLRLKKKLYVYVVEYSYKGLLFNVGGDGYWTIAITFYLGSGSSQLMGSIFCFFPIFCWVGDSSFVSRSLSFVVVCRSMLIQNSTSQRAHSEYSRLIKSLGHRQLKLNAGKDDIDTGKCWLECKPMPVGTNEIHFSVQLTDAHFSTERQLCTSTCCTNWKRGNTMCHPYEKVNRVCYFEQSLNPLSVWQQDVLFTNTFSQA